MLQAHPGSGHLMLEMPVGCCVRIRVFLHAPKARFEWVIRAKAAGQQAQLELEATNRRASHRGDGGRRSIWGGEMKIERQKRVVPDDLFGAAQGRLRYGREVPDPAGQVMCGASSPMPEEGAASRGGKSITRKPVKPAA